MTFSSVRFVSFVPAQESGLYEVQRISDPRVSGFYKTADIAVIQAGLISSRESGRSRDQCCSILNPCSGCWCAETNVGNGLPVARAS
jgi:hypothetical protein